MTFAQLEQKLSYLSTRQLDFVKQAYLFAEKTHSNSFRKSGEPFIQHPLLVASKLADLHLDEITIAAALLHDIHEDTNTTLPEIEKNFGKKVTTLVEGVSKLGRLKFRFAGVLKTRKEAEIETLRKMFVVMASDLRVVLIKLSDRLHNLETLYALPSKRQREIAKESLEIYAPLAYRLGIGEFKGKIEDLSFSYAYPKEYQEILKMVGSKFKAKQQYLKRIKKIILEDLETNKIKAQVDGRVKHLYSLYQKLKKYDYDISKIHDLAALRIIVHSVPECYKVLGLIHHRFKPLLGRIKDYIAMSKPNGYQSLHTTVFCSDGEIIEFQIRTEKMHQEAEYGIAAHWHYSEEKIESPSKIAPQKHLAWINELIDWQNKAKTPWDFWEILHSDVFKQRIFVFTPKGETIDLPEGATAVDFAYYLHSDIGDHTGGAKVNGKIVAIKHLLKNGDMVEILINKNAKPSYDWLAFVKTPKAREKIRTWLNQNQEKY